MKSIIFKNEKKAKTYRIFSAKDQGCFKKGELIQTVRTDKIEKLTENEQYQVFAEEVK